MIDHQYYGLRHDVWGLGVLTFFLFAGEFPFKGDSDAELMDNIQKKEPDWSLLKKRGTSNLIIGFIMKMLIKIPGDRATIKEVLKHRVIKTFKNPPKKKKKGEDSDADAKKEKPDSKSESKKKKKLQVYSLETSIEF